MRHLEGSARDQRSATLFGEPDGLRIVVGGKTVMRGEPEIERLACRFGILKRGEIPCLLLQRGAERGEHQIVKALLPFGLGFRIGQQIAQRVLGVGGLEIARGRKLARMPPERCDGFRDVGKLFAQEIVAPGRTGLVHVDADDHRIPAGNEKQLTVVVARRPVEEFGKMHRNLRSARPAMAAVPRAAVTSDRDLANISRRFRGTGSRRAAAQSLARMRQINRSMRSCPKNGSFSNTKVGTPQPSPARCARSAGETA
jgi:hypothetical protein